MVGLYPILFQLCTEFCDVILHRFVFCFFFQIGNTWLVMIQVDEKVCVT